MWRRLLPLVFLAMVPACTSSAPPSTPQAAPTWRPETGGCHGTHTLRISRETYSAADCSKNHVYQTAYVGEVSGSPALATISPEVNTLEYREIWRDCDQRLAAFFGGPWRDFRLKLRVSFPTAGAWDSGARWYSCETAVYDDYEWNSIPTTGSLEGGAGRLAELRLGCYQTPAETAAPVTAKPCTEPHNLEYVGTYELDVPWPTIETGGPDQLFDRCFDLINAFVGALSPSNVAAWHPFENDWKAGDRNVRCFLWLEDVQVSKSLKGAGTSGWPRP